MQSITKDTPAAALEALLQNDWDALKNPLGLMTSKQAAAFDNHYLQEEGLSERFNRLLWTHCVSWAFEVLWAGEYLKAEADRVVPFDELPCTSTLDFDTPMKDLDLWAIHDAHSVY